MILENMILYRLSYRYYYYSLLVSISLIRVNNIAILCPSFISDCLETLEEIDIRGRETFFNAGGKNMTYIPCLNDSEDTINLLENLVRAS